MFMKAAKNISGYNEMEKNNQAKTRYLERLAAKWKRA